MHALRYAHLPLQCPEWNEHGYGLACLTPAAAALDALEQHRAFLRLDPDELVPHACRRHSAGDNGRLRSRCSHRREWNEQVTRSAWRVLWIEFLLHKPPRTRGHDGRQVVFGRRRAVDPIARAGPDPLAADGEMPQCFLDHRGL